MTALVNPGDRFLVAGHTGLVGSATVRQLHKKGYPDVTGASSAEVDLRDATATADFVRSVEPDVLVMAAARVGGIGANSSYPVDFLNDNLRIQTNLFEAAHRAGVRRVLFLGSSCIYPREAAQPIVESSLLTGPLEPTNQAYAIAKISGIVAVASYRSQYGHSWISAMPTNLYGPGDNFDLQNSHVLPALIRRFHEARITDAPAVTVWGTGSPRREFLHADDLAAALVLMLERFDGDSHLNVGTGSDVPIRDLAELIREVVGYQGELQWDTTKPDGTPRKLLDVAQLRALGWQPEIGLAEGIAATYQWYQESIAD